MENKQCKQCQKQFNVTDQDLVFLDKISPTFAGQKFDIPAPTLCPLCRWQRRIAWRNEYILYKRKSDLGGQDLVSKHHSETKFPVYHVKEWQSDAWDAKQYGQEYDNNKPFFDQFSELINKVPNQNVVQTYTQNVNSEYTNYAGNCKDCYMVFESDYDEACYYSRGLASCKDCVDCLATSGSQLCYEGINLNDCFDCSYCQDLDNCSECYLSSNLIGCKNCFGCDNLSQKQYYLFNENVGQEKWNEFVSQFKFMPEKITEAYGKLEEIRRTNPKKFAKIMKCENSQGDHLNNCKNAFFSFDSQNLQDCAYCFEVSGGAKDALDFSTFGYNTSMIYECNTCGEESYNVLFCNDCPILIRDCLYCHNVQSSKNCFGCVGMRKAEYCILNKQYTPEEYNKKVSEIITDMQARGEWGEFMPMSISVHGYNETLANDYFPLDKVSAESIGANWREDTRLLQYEGPFYQPKASIEDYINNEEERQALLSGVLKCQATGKPFKILPQELAFYLKHKFSVPTTCFEARHKARIAKRNPFELWQRQCDCEETSHGHSGRCENKFESTYSSDRPYRVYCESCYQQSIG